MNGNLRGDAQEILAVLTRVVGHAANHALLIEKIVIERRDRAHVNAAENEHSAFLERGERRRDKLSGRREDNRRVEFFGRLGRGFARPHRAELQCKLLVLRSSRACVHFNAPMPRDLSRDMRGRSKTVKREAPAALDSR